MATDKRKSTENNTTIMGVKMNRQMKLLGLVLLMLVANFGCKTSTGHGSSALADADIAKAEKYFDDGCSESGSIAGNKFTKAKDPESCLGLKFLKCSLVTDDGVQYCKEVAEAMKNPEFKESAFEIRHSYDEGCFKIRREKKEDGTNGPANEQVRLTGCKASLATMDCLAGKLDECEKMKPDIIEDAALKHIGPVYQFACEQGRVGVCRQYYEHSHNRTEPLQAIKIGCKNGHAEVCTLKNEIDANARAIEDKKRELARKEKEKEQNDFKLIIDQEVASGKCDPGRFQNFSNIASNMSNQVTQLSNHEWRLSAQEILVLTVKKQSFSFRDVSRQHLAMIITESPVYSFTVHDSKGNQAGSPSAMDEHIAQMTVASVLGGLPSGYSLKFLIMNPFETAVIRADGQGCALIAILSK